MFVLRIRVRIQKDGSTFHPPPPPPVKVGVAHTIRDELVTYSPLYL